MSREHFLFNGFSSIYFTDTMICLIFPSVLGGLPRQLEGLRSYADLSFQGRALSPTDSRASFAAWSGSIRAALPYSTSLPEREKRIKGLSLVYESWEESVGKPRPYHGTLKNHMKQSRTFPYCLLITLSAPTFKSQHSPFLRQTWDKK